jgi:hypothetical protein
MIVSERRRLPDRRRSENHIRSWRAALHGHCVLVSRRQTRRSAIAFSIAIQHGADLPKDAHRDHWLVSLSNGIAARRDAMTRKYERPAANARVFQPAA